jgi:Iron-containing alcohol dehydrogenase
MIFQASDMEAFEYTALPARVVFGVGTLPRVADEMTALECKRAFVLSDPHHAAAGAARLMDALGKLGVHLSTDAVMHTPVDVTERVMEKLVACNADCLVSLGGGSTIGLGKALALRTDLPQIVLPTTYAGSEATPILGETDAGKKSTVRSMKVLPEVIIYDVELTRPSAGPVAGVRDQRDRARRRGAVREGSQPGHFEFRGAGHCRARTCATPDHCGADRSRCAGRRFVWSLGRWILPRSGGNVTPS